MRRYLFRSILVTVAIVGVPLWAIWGAGIGLKCLIKRFSELWAEV